MKDAGENIDSEYDKELNIPIYSLYGNEEIQNLNRLNDIDVLIIDIQDVGVRCYTYISTCAKVIDHISKNKFKTKIIVCDRPNPLGNRKAGHSFNNKYKSLVHYVKTQFQHGKNIGEILKTHNNATEHPIPLEIIPYREEFNHILHEWIPPSPGLPTWNSVFLYPGLVLLEGITVGRGTTLSFSCIAAPGLDSQRLAQIINSRFSKSIYATPITIVPKSGIYSNKQCSGVKLEIVDYKKLQSFEFGIEIVKSLASIYPDFNWYKPFEHFWIDELSGRTEIRKSVRKAFPYIRSMDI